MRISELRVGVTLFPAYVEACVLEETDLFDVKCPSPGKNGFRNGCQYSVVVNPIPGLSVRVMELFQFALKHQYRLILVNLADSNGSGAWDKVGMSVRKDITSYSETRLCRRFARLKPT